MENLDALVDAARAGGDWAFARLWEELSPAVAGYLRARGVHDVEDATSEVFLAAFQRLPGFEGSSAGFRSWLFTIAHHRGVDAVRAQTRATRETSFQPEADSRATVSAEDIASGNARAMQTRALLNLLTAEQREVLLLRYIADLSLDETAAITGRRLDAVKQLQRRGIATLRRHLDGSTSTQPIPDHPADSITEAR